MIEVVVSAGGLMVVMSCMSALIVRIDSVWKDTGHHRVAMNELSNQIERLTLMSPNEVDAAVSELKPSLLASRTLSDARLSGSVVDDEWGRRVILQIDWRRKHPGQPMTLTAWLPAEKELGGEETP